ncbi:PepSY-associated TM helix domain-containing protein [Sphingobium sp. HBC34]|uniref:PepSY-associated TM helix domain-containing protein n=1 Tax=Sphingobium cyanobacteriorum TaxID=3063954 RepID=A0ABT8ZTK1_9SPHN|nr:PepSY-associated TM helix domain-containing protein [Sphingobium sp. HBC34]MDO7836786.1 PepSY-associated TM helix domain-containing protein [Sphingobium sp. HBC34]
MTRPQWLRIHRIIGLAMAAFLLVQALTGALLLYRGPATRLIDPAGMTSRGTGPVISAGDAVARAASALPGHHVTRLFAPDGEGATWFAQLQDGQGHMAYASIDPAGGALLRKGGLFTFPVEAALQIHYRLLAGKAGMTVVMLNGIALLMMAVSGLYFWWPRRNFAKALTIRWSLSPRLVLRQAHRTTGVVAAAFLILIAGTGLLLIVPELTDGGATAMPSAAPPAMIDRSLRLAQSAFPENSLRDLRIDGGRMIVNFAAPERNARAIHRAIVTLDQPRIIRATRAETNGAMWMVVLPIHAGDVIGPAGPALLVLVALVLAALSLSGPILWWQARAQRRRPTPRKAHI